MPEFAVGARDHFRQSWHVLIHASVLIVCPLYFVSRFGEESLGFAIKAAVIILLVVLVPHAVLHARYTLAERGTRISFDKRSRRVRYEIGDQTADFSLNEIDAVKVVRSRALANRDLQWFPWDSYCYALIKLRDGRQILVTSLLVPDLEFPIKMPNETQRLAIYCCPSSSTKLKELKNDRVDGAAE